MKESIPIHRHDDLSDTGIHARIVRAHDVGSRPVDYAHRDDYYIFGLMVRGGLCCEIDFKIQSIGEGELQFIRPGQVHRFISCDDFEGYMLMLERGLVEDRYKLIFEEASVNGVAASTGRTDMEQLKALFCLIHGMLGQQEDIIVIRHLVSAFVGVVAACFRKTCCQRPEYNSRRTNIVVQLNALLNSDLCVSHSPAYYAERLHISSAYLNEVVKSVAGCSAGAYIRNEIVLHAKRLLCHTDLSVKQIACGLGFEDYAYFTRMFTKAVGKSPLKFRAKP